MKFAYLLRMLRYPLVREYPSVVLPVFQADSPVIQSDLPVIQSDSPVIQADSIVVQADLPVSQVASPVVQTKFSVLPPKECPRCWLNILESCTEKEPWGHPSAGT